MVIDYDDPELTDSDEEYFAPSPRERRVGRFDARLLQEPITVLHHRKPLLFSAKDSAREAMRAMQSEHRGCVLITEDGTSRSRLQGIFTERDVLLRIVDRGKNPATLPIGEVMTPDPECLAVDSTVAHALNKMSVGGFRHVPVVAQDLDVDGPAAPRAGEVVDQDLDIRNVPERCAEIGLDVLRVAGSNFVERDAQDRLFGTNRCERVLDVRVLADDRLDLLDNRIDEPKRCTLR